MKELFKRYGAYGTIRLLFSIAVSRLFLSAKVRIVRLPYFIRGARYIKWGNNFTAGVNLRIDADPINIDLDKSIVVFGNNVQVNDYVHIGAVEKIGIGNNVLIASNVFISDHNHGNYIGEFQSSPDSTPSSRPISSSPVIIEDNVWIGEHVSILLGVKIGKGSIIGANAVVSKDIPAFCIAVGAPARVIKKYNHASLKWEKVE